MGENEQGGMLRNVAVMGLIAMIAIAIISATVGLTANMKATTNGTVSKVGTNIKSTGTDSSENNSIDNLKIESDKTNVTYYYDTTHHTATATGLSNTNTLDIFIPDYIVNDGVTFKVTSIAANAFQHKGITSVAISNSVTGIGDNAFRENKLTNVIIPNSVSTLGAGAFNQNLLKSVTISQNLTVIGANTFKDNQLRSVEIPINVKTIGAGAFTSNNIAQVNISASVSFNGAFDSSTIVNKS